MQSESETSRGIVECELSDRDISIPSIEPELGPIETGPGANLPHFNLPSEGLDDDFEKSCTNVDTARGSMRSSMTHFDMG